MDIMQLFVGTILALWINKKIKIKHIFIFTLLAFAFISFIHIYRIQGNHSETLKNAIGKMLAIYFLSPLKAFDMLINGEITFSKGQTFVLISNISNKLFGIKLFVNSNNFDGWVYVPYPTNVYTCMMPFYSDYKLWGVAIFGNMLVFFLDIYL